MLFERFEDRGLAHYSYAVGSRAEGRVAIVDPRRDVDVYTRYAARRGLEITHVLETHIHADFASGARELARRTGAEFLASAHDRGESYEVGFPHRDLEDGEAVSLGTVKIQALHTPGHTPEHLSFLLFDLDGSPEVPQRMLSGDFLFVGSVGRPDLLGAEATRGLAERMFGSLRERLAPLPDGLRIHPAHGSGSMCGSGMGSDAASTLGLERASNPYLDPDLDREAFVKKLVGTVPPFPPYYRRMKELNSRGPALLDELPGLRGVAAASFRQLVDRGHLVVDVRDRLAFAGGHIPGSYGIELDPSLSTWAGWLLPPDRPLLLVAAAEDDVEPAVRRLVRVGLDDVRGYLLGGVKGWIDAGYPVESLPQLPPRQLRERQEEDGRMRVLDVRTEEEWRSGRIAGARHVMLGELPDRLGELPRDEPLAVVCDAGYRSTVAASLLRRSGFREVLNVTGGMGAWKHAGLPVEVDGDIGDELEPEAVAPGGRDVTREER